MERTSKLEINITTKIYSAIGIQKIDALETEVSGCGSDLAFKNAVADDRVQKHERKDEKAPQNMNARLDCGAAASSMVRTKGIMYGQNEMARAPKADAKINMTIGKGSSSRRNLTLTASTSAASAPKTGKTNKYGRSVHLPIT